MCVRRKKAQLKKKRGVPQINEQMLFHGTSSEFVEAICIHNFDWRINGIHGAVFGKGNYRSPRSSSSPRRDAPLLREDGLLRNSGLRYSRPLRWESLAHPSSFWAQRSHFLQVRDRRRALTAGSMALGSQR